MLVTAPRNSDAAGAGDTCTLPPAAAAEGAFHSFSASQEPAQLQEGAGTLCGPRTGRRLLRVCRLCSLVPRTVQQEQRRPQERGGPPHRVRRRRRRPAFRRTAFVTDECGAQSCAGRT